MRLTFDQEKRVIKRLLEHLGASEEEARITAEVLAEADLRGFGSHGILRLPYILRALRRGTIIPNAKMRVIRETPSTALLDGGHGLGHPVAVRAMKLAIKKAKKTGVSAVAVRNTNHFGIAGYYAQLATDENLIGIVTTTTDPLVCPWGGAEPVIGTNALSVGIPAEPHPVLLDMAMSSAARGKLVEARKKGEKIPENWAIDSEGRPTTDPAKALKGALLPFGGVKGYALAVILEILAGPLGGSAAGKEVHGTLEPISGFSTKGDFMMAIDPLVFGPLEEFKTRVRRFLDEIKASRKAKGVREILLPGEPEFRTRDRHLIEGIPVADEVWAEVNRIAKEIGIDILKEIR
ncbi:MAG: Ldh family oxidoreductase [Hadesarchaea archaeon]|nr:Ldh family oxidoreductase [Hadesarchaea archaeon]